DTRAPMTLRRAMMPLAARYADVIVSWGERVAAQHPGADRFGERLVIVYPPGEADELAPDPARRRVARQRPGVADRRRPDCAFRIIGAPSPAHPGLDNRLRAEAERLGLALGQSIDLVDPGDDVATLIQGIDVFLMTSPARSEGMPTAILEAMLAAKPVVATDAGATRELVIDRETGMLVPPGDPDRVAAAVLRLLEDQELR